MLLRTLTLFCGLTFAQAKAENQLFSEVPILAGLKCIADKSYIFDHPEGRFGEVLLETGRRSAKKIVLFYIETLKSLGWHQRGKKTANTEPTKLFFDKENEQLQLIIDEKFVRFILKPQKK